MNGPELYEWRRRLTISQAVAAGLLGRSTRTIRNWESGAVPIPHWVPALCEAAEARDDLPGRGSFEKAGRPVEI